MRDRLDWVPGVIHGAGGKPKGNWQTFWRILAIYDENERQTLAGMAAVIGQINRRVGPRNGSTCNGCDRLGCTTPKFNIRDRMKKTITGAILALCAFGSWAAGQYDGIYQALAVSSTTYYSVHQNGNTLIAASFGTIPISGTSFNSARGSITPSTLNSWDVIQGTINGNKVTLSGTVHFGGCNQVITVVFDQNGGALMTLMSSVETIAGRNAGLNCAAGVLPGSIFALTKVF